MLTAVLARQAAAAVGVKTCWPWETGAYVVVCSAAEADVRDAPLASAPTGRRGAGYRVAAARPQLVMHPPLIGGALSDAFV